MFLPSSCSPIVAIKVSISPKRSIWSLKKLLITNFVGVIYCITLFIEPSSISITANLVSFFDWIAKVDIIPSNIFAPSKLFIKLIPASFKV